MRVYRADVQVCRHGCECGARYTPESSTLCLLQKHTHTAKAGKQHASYIHITHIRRAMTDGPAPHTRQNSWQETLFHSVTFDRSVFVLKAITHESQAYTELQ